MNIILKHDSPKSNTLFLRAQQATWSSWSGWITVWSDADWPPVDTRLAQNLGSLETQILFIKLYRCAVESKESIILTILDSEQISSLFQNAGICIFSNILEKLF